MALKKIALAAAALSIICCGGFSTPAPAKAADPLYTWRYATLAPNGIGWATHIQELLFPLIEERTNGEVRVKVYWGGVMGDDEDCIKKMQAGKLNGAGLSGQGATLAIPEMSVLELPFLFQDFEEVDHIRESMMPTWDRLAAKHGFFLIGLIDQDFDQIYSIHYDMTEPGHFEKSRVITWFGPLEENLLHSLGSTPVPADVPEIAAKVRQGLADVTIGPAIWQLGSQLHSIWKYINPAKIRYSPALILQTAQDFEGSSHVKEYKNMLLEERKEFTRTFVARVREDNEKCLNAMYEYGIIKAEMTDAELAEFKRRTRPVWDKMAGRLYSRDLLNQVTGRLNEYRAAHP